MEHFAFVAVKLLRLCKVDGAATVAVMSRNVMFEVAQRCPNWTQIRLFFNLYAMLVQMREKLDWLLGLEGATS